MDTYVKNTFEILKDNSTVNQFAVLELEELLQSEETDYAEMQRLFYLISGDLCHDKTGSELQSNNAKIRFLDILQLNVYKFLKKKDFIEEEKITASVMAGILIEKLSDYLCSSLGISGGYASLLLSVLAIIIIKVGINSWCAWFYENKVHGNQDMEDALTRLMNE